MPRESRRRRKNAESSGNERWLVSYADFITLLFAFFVVMYATSSSDEKKQQEFEKSVKKYLLGMGNGGAAGGAGGVATGPKKNYDSLIEPPIKKFKNNSNKVNELLQSIQRYVQAQFTEKQMSVYIKDIRSDSTGVRVIVDAHQIFAANSVLFTKSGVQFIDVLKDLLSGVNQQVIIENHAANNVPKGSHKTLWELTALRSTTLVRYLLQSGFNGELVPIGYGSTRPLWPNKNNKNNTRLELYFPEKQI